MKSFTKSYFALFSLFIVTSSYGGDNFQDDCTVPERLPHKIRTCIGNRFVNVPVMTAEEMTNALDEIIPNNASVQYGFPDMPLSKVSGTYIRIKNLDLSSQDNRPRILSAVALDILIERVRNDLLQPIILNLSGNYITPQGILALSKGFEKGYFSMLQNLNLSHIYYPLIDEDDTFIDLKRNNIFLEDTHRAMIVSHLCGSLLKIKTLKTLDLSRNLIMTRESLDIKKKLETSTITYLDLRHNIIDASYTEMLQNGEMSIDIKNQSSPEGCTLF